MIWWAVAIAMTTPPRRARIEARAEVTRRGNVYYVEVKR